jgi:hypothetical protein
MNLFFSQGIQTFELSNESKLYGFILVAENFDPAYLPTFQVYLNRIKPIYKTPEVVKETYKMIIGTHEILKNK